MMKSAAITRKVAGASSIERISRPVAEHAADAAVAAMRRRRASGAYRRMSVSKQSGASVQATSVARFASSPMEGVAMNKARDAAAIPHPANQRQLRVKSVRRARKMVLSATSVMIDVSGNAVGISCVAAALEKKGPGIGPKYRRPSKQVPYAEDEHSSRASMHSAISRKYVLKVVMSPSFCPQVFLAQVRSCSGSARGFPLFFRIRKGRCDTKNPLAARMCRRSIRPMMAMMQGESVRLGSRRRKRWERRVCSAEGAF